MEGKVAHRLWSTVLVTGSSRGIGLELVRQLVKRKRVLATCRDPGTASELEDVIRAANRDLPGHCKTSAILALDVSSEESIAALPAALAGIGVDAVDYVVHNAGVAASTHPVDPVASATKSEMMRCFEVNCCGPLLLTQTLLPLLRAAGNTPNPFENSALDCGGPYEPPKVLFVGSDMGCVSSTVSGGEGWTSSASYRCSKAALHMLMRCFDQELSSSSPGGAPDTGRDICFAAVHPGWVNTDMGSAGGRSADLDVEDGAEGVLCVLYNTMRDAKSSGGRLYDNLGQEMAW